MNIEQIEKALKSFEKNPSIKTMNVLGGKLKFSKKYKGGLKIDGKKISYGGTERTDLPRFQNILHEQHPEFLKKVKKEFKKKNNKKMSVEDYIKFKDTDEYKKLKEDVIGKNEKKLNSIRKYMGSMPGEYQLDFMNKIQEILPVLMLPSGLIPKENVNVKYGLGDLYNFINNSEFPASPEINIMLKRLFENNPNNSGSRIVDLINYANKIKNQDDQKQLFGLITNAVNDMVQSYKSPLEKINYKLDTNVEYGANNPIMKYRLTHFNLGL